MYKLGPLPGAVALEDLDLLAQVETATVGHWRHLGFVNRAVQPMLRGRRVVGTAITVAIPAMDSTLLHHALSVARPGDIIVVDRLGDDRHACWGGGVTLAAKAAGVVAAIIDGPCTDFAEIQASDFPIWSRGLSSVTTRQYNLGGALNVPVCCGGAVVSPGDAILADDCGVLVLPAEEVREVVNLALLKQSSITEFEKRIQSGLKLGELSGATGKVLSAVSGSDPQK